MRHFAGIGALAMSASRQKPNFVFNLGAVGWSLSPEHIATLDRASDIMPAYPYYPYRTQEGFARINPSPV